MDWELWGTFSVGDHLRRRAFVADVLLYDRLVVPTPPASDSDEQKRWRKMGWRPKRQRRLLNLLGRERIIEVPWTEYHRQNWESQYKKAKTSKQAGIEGPEARSQLARNAAADVARTVQARDSFDWKGFKTRGGRPEEVDDLAHLTTRQVLVDWSSLKDDTRIFMGLPRVEVDPVVAYGSYASFSGDHEVTAPEKPASSNLLNVFGWEFLVPNDTNRSDEDLLKESLDLANLDETKEHRRAFHQWRREMLITGHTEEAARKQMEDLVQRYRSAVRKTKIQTGVKYAFAVVSAAATAAAVVVPPLGVAGAFAGLGSFVISESTQKKVPESLNVAAMFHDARRRFGWYKRRGNR